MLSWVLYTEEKNNVQCSCHVVGAFLYIFYTSWNLCKEKPTVFFLFFFFFFTAFTHLYRLNIEIPQGPKRPELLQGSTGSEVTKIHSAWVKWWFHRSVLLQIKGDLLRSPPGLDSRLVSQLTVREAIVYDVKVTAALYLWGFPAGWCPSRRGRQSGYFLCLPQWWSDGKAVSLGFSAYD